MSTTKAADIFSTTFNGSGELDAQSRVYNIPAGYSFVDVLASKLLNAYKHDEMGLARVQILLPTRRACQSLQDSFLRQTDGRAILLPQLSPVFSPDEDAAFFLSGMDISHLPKPIESTRRLLMLAPLIQRAFPEDLTTAQALALAQHLAQFIDNLYIENLSLDDLSDLAPDDPKLSFHWQKTVTFLKDIISEFWPDILAETGCVDAGAHRVALINTYTQHWRAQPPKHPVIIAGTMASVPALADMIGELLQSDMGALVLAGLDQHMDDESWHCLAEGHPQYLLKQLLERLNLNRQNIQNVVFEPEINDVRYAVMPPQIRERDIAARQKLVSEMMRPPETLQKWAEELNCADGLEEGHLHPLAPALNNVHLLEVKNSFQEARLVACIIRDVLDDPNHSVMVITPNRKLASFIQKEMLFWGIHIDDSAGVPLAQKPIGRFILSLCRLVQNAFDPHSLLSVLKHDFCRGGAEIPDHFNMRRFITKLELKLMRGFRQYQDLEQLDALIHATWGADAKDTHKDGHMIATWASILPALKTLRPFSKVEDCPSPYQMLRILLQSAEMLASTANELGETILWRGDDGEQGASFFSSLLDSLRDAQSLSMRDFTDFLQQLMTSVSIRPKYGTHPRIRLLGLAEARLQTADTVIMAGLNEGSWPSDPGHNPWMSRPMVKDYGFPSPERALSQSAHDFTQSFCNARVFMTRSLSADGALTVPSRWISRFKTAIKTAGLALDHHTSEQHLKRAVLLPTAPQELAPIKQPQPILKNAAKIERISITDVGGLITDPYAFYAKRVLRLRPLDPIDQAPDLLLRGQIMHESLELFTKNFPSQLPADPEAELIKIGRQLFDGFGAWNAELHGFWWSSYMALVAWFASHERQWRKNGQTIFSELDCHHHIATETSSVLVTGRADRIEKHHDGWVIIDYKTGTPPAGHDVQMGYAPQLPTTAALLMKGAFETLVPLLDSDAPAAKDIKDISYWKISGANSTIVDPVGARNRKEGVTAVSISEEAITGLSALLAHYNDHSGAFISYPLGNERAAPYSNDYKHLSRISEWSVAEDGDTDSEVAA